MGIGDTEVVPVFLQLLDIEIDVLQSSACCFSSFYSGTVFMRTIFVGKNIRTIAAALGGL